MPPAQPEQRASAPSATDVPMTQQSISNLVKAVTLISQNVDKLGDRMHGIKQQLADVCWILAEPQGPSRQPESEQVLTDN